jgi:hypothetical protein
LNVLGEEVRLTVTESHSRDVPEPIPPAILCTLKSVLETSRPLALKMEGPSPCVIEAVRKVVAEKPWRQ